MPTTSPFGSRSSTSKERAIERKEGIRYHESAHAVAALALGFEDVWVDLSEDSENPDPITKFIGRKAWRPREERERALAVTFAGTFGEVLHFGRSVIGGGLENDGESADELLRRFPERERGQVADIARSSAREKLEARWPDVEYLARALTFSPVAWVEYVDDLLIVSLPRVQRMPSERAVHG